MRPYDGFAQILPVNLDLLEAAFLQHADVELL